MSKHQVYVAAPIGARTGGPEALHQLVDALRVNQVDAVLWPIGRSRFLQPVPEYALYDAPVAKSWPSRGCVTVVPEVSPKELHITLGATRWLWWLSVDNSPHPSVQRLKGEALQAPGSGQGGSRRSPTAVLRRSANRHLASWGARRSGFLFQSEYARTFCKENLGKGGYTVSDYLRPIPYRPWNPPAAVSVAYNPAKSEKLVSHLRDSMPEIQFRAISGLDYGQVLEVLATSSVYLEAGHLPGRDRLPREAARVGCPVLMLRRGAGGYEGDFPLPARFRIENDLGWLEQTRAALLTVIANPVAASREQEPFQAWVRSDRERFLGEVKAWWMESEGGRRQ